MATNVTGGGLKSCGGIVMFVKCEPMYLKIKRKIFGERFKGESKRIKCKAKLVKLDEFQKFIKLKNLVV